MYRTTIIKNIHKNILTAYLPNLIIMKKRVMIL